MLVLDEAHKLRNLYGVDPPPQVAVRFKEALEKRRSRYVLMLTATPIQNRLWDLYSLVDLLTVARGHENPSAKRVCSHANSSPTIATRRAN
jgi:SNF2 family DNA or RNA helicase